MKKFKITLLVIGLVFVCGCSSNSNSKDVSTSTQQEVNNSIKKDDTQKAWDYVDKAFEKLKKEQFSYSGLETEIAHIGVDDGRLKATFAQSSFYGNVVEYGKEMQIKQGNTDLNFIKDNCIRFLGHGDGVLNVELNMETAKQDFTGYFVVFNIKDGMVVSDDGETNESLDTFVDTSEGSHAGYDMVYKIDGFTSLGDWGSFMVRGNTAIRLIPNEFFTGEIKENENGSEVIFTFSPASEKYKSFLKSDIYKMMYDAYCPIDETDEKGEVAFKDQLKEAKIIYKFDKEGYPISYERFSHMYIEEFNQDYPYVVNYVFERK